LMMPLIFGWITISLPSGLGLYYVLSNLVQLLMQYISIGGGPVNWGGIIGLNNQPVLPRMLEQRTRQAEAARRISGSDEEPTEDQGGQRARKPRGSSPDGSTDRNGAVDGATAQRRRRYASGRRRGRR